MKVINFIKQKIAKDDGYMHIYIYIYISMDVYACIISIKNTKSTSG